MHDLQPESSVEIRRRMGRGASRAAAVFLAGLAAAAGEAQEVRLDSFGEPLPRGAIARLGRAPRLRHAARIMALAFSPDGTLLASGAMDDRVSPFEASSAGGSRSSRSETRGSCGP